MEIGSLLWFDSYGLAVIFDRAFLQCVFSADQTSSSSSSSSNTEIKESENWGKELGQGQIRL